MNDKEYQVVLEKIDELLNSHNPVYVAIEGKCSSGKTTLAKQLKEHYGCEVIHMDDFFLQPYQRTKQRLAEIGGNIDYERFEEQVITNLKKNCSFTYQPFNCSTMDFDEVVRINKNKLYVIEGSYSFHSYFTLPYHLKIVIDIDQETQKQRIIKRNGIEGYPMFRDKWIPLENTYLKEQSILQQGDIFLLSREQEKHDIAMDKLSIKEYRDPFAEKEIKAEKTKKNKK